jgi:hypothetical protein
MKKLRFIILAAILALNQAVLFSESASAATFVCGASGTYTVSDQGVLGNGSNCSGAVVLDSSVTSINYATFFDETGLGITSLTIPATTTTIYTTYPFGFRNKNISEFIVDSNNPNYSSEDGVLYNKNKTVLIAYPKGKSGTSYTVPSSVTQVTGFAFTCPKYLQSINFGANVTDLNSSAFGYNGACWSGSVTSEIVVSGDNPNYSASDGVLFNKSVTNLMFYPYAKTSTSYVVPNTVTSITKISFNPYLTNITLPNGLTRIDSYAFEGSALTSVTIPDSVNNYGSFSFWGSRNLQSFTVGEGNSSLKSLDGVIYSKDGTRLREYPGGKGASSFVIPDGVTSTDLQWISSAQNLNYITVPASVTTIASGYTSNYYKPESYLIFQGNSNLTSISGNYAKNIIYCGTPNAAITNHATQNSTTPRCPTENQAPDFSLSTSNLSVTRGTALTPYSISTAVAPDFYTISPGIIYTPGLSFNSATGTISGTPSSTAAARTYTITGVNWKGSTSRQFSITVENPATAPGAPTIESVTALSANSASISFRAPASNGGAIIETYTVTSTPGSITARLYQAGSGTITITGLSSSTSYTFRVTASNRVGTSTQSSASSSIRTPQSDAEIAAAAAEAARVAAAAEAARVAAAAEAAEAARVAAVLAEDARLKAEEDAKKKAEEEARLKALEEARLKAEEDAKKKAAEDAKKKAEEEARLKAAEEAKKKAAEEAKQKAAAEEEAKEKAEEAKKKAEEAKKKAIEAAKKKADEDDVKKKTADEAKKKAADEEIKKKLEESKKKLEEAKKKAADEAKKELEESKKKLEAEAKKDLEESKKKLEAEAKKELEETKKKLEAEAKKKLEEAKKKAEEDGNKLDDEEKKKLEEESKKKLEEAKKKAEAEVSKELAQDNKKLESEVKKDLEQETKKLESEVKKDLEETKKQLDGDVKTAEEVRLQAIPAALVTAEIVSNSAAATAEIVGTGEVASAPVERTEIKSQFISSALSAGGNKAALKLVNLKVGTKIVIKIRRSVR